MNFSLFQKFELVKTCKREKNHASCIHAPVNSMPRLTPCPAASVAHESMRNAIRVLYFAVFQCSRSKFGEGLWVLDRGWFDCFRGGRSHSTVVVHGHCENSFMQHESIQFFFIYFNAK